MKIALSTRIFEDDCPYDACIEMAARAGYDCVEIRTGARQLPVNADAAHVRAVRRSAADAGVAISSIASFTGHYAGRAEAICARELADFTRLAQMAAELGADNIRHWPGNWGITSASASDEHWKQAAEWMHRAILAAEPYGVYPSIEIHFNTICDTIDSALKLIDMVGHDRLRFTPDVQNLYFQNEPYAGVYEKLGVERIANVHFKDAIELMPGSPHPEPYECNGRRYAFRRLNQGAIDNYAVIAELKALGYDRCLTIETGFGSKAEAYDLARHECCELRKMTKLLGCG